MNTLQLDLTHYLCPLPLLMAKKALQDPKIKRLILALNLQTDLTDFALFCEAQNLKLSKQKSDSYLKLILEKRPDSPE